MRNNMCLSVRCMIPSGSSPADPATRCAVDAAVEATTAFYTQHYQTQMAHMYRTFTTTMQQVIEKAEQVRNCVLCRGAWGCHATSLFGFQVWGTACRSILRSILRMPFATDGLTLLHAVGGIDDPIGSMISECPHCRRRGPHFPRGLGSLPPPAPPHPQPLSGAATRTPVGEHGRPHRTASVLGVQQANHARARTSVAPSEH